MLLQEQGASCVNLRDIKPTAERYHHGRKPLHWAAFYGHEVVVELLLVTGEASVDYKDNNGRTPLS
jgi:ankyrin repeat protein